MTELMIAVVVLIIVIVATSKIFGTASQITGIGIATQNMITEATAIESRIRNDFSRLTDEGFFAIRCVAVRNDVKGVSQPLLNPNMPPSAIIRADQLVFFTNGVESMQTGVPGGYSSHKGQAAASRVYYGHAFQLPNASPTVNAGNNVFTAHDPNLTPPGNWAPWNSVPPWYSGTVPMANVKYASNSGDGVDVFGLGTPAAGPATINVQQPGARQWLLVRQNVALVDDDIEDPNTNSKTVLFGGVTSPENLTARSIFLSGLAPSSGQNSLVPTAPIIKPGIGFSREIRAGRLDGAASELDEIRRWVTMRPGTSPIGGGITRRLWADNSEGAPDQRSIIRTAVYYPRAERKAPSMNRIDQALTNNVISSACSSFAIDWTYFNGVGHFDTDKDGVITLGGVDLGGIIIPGNVEQPWFGMPECEKWSASLPGPPASFDTADHKRGTRPLSAGFPNPIPNWLIQQNPTSITFSNIDGSNGGEGHPYVDALDATNKPTVMRYEAFFGYNQTRPYWDESITPPGASLPGVPSSKPYLPTVNARSLAGYTPFPSAIRITMTLHDPDGRLESGREFQFVINLPQRTLSTEWHN